MRITAVVSGGEDALRSVRAQERPADEVLVAPRAAALEAATGDAIAWCDEGDEWAPGHLRVLSAALTDDVDLVYGDVEGVPGGDYDFFRLSWSDNFIAPGAALARTAAVRAAGGFDASLRAHDDWDLWLRMAVRGTLRRVPHVVVRRSPPPEGETYWEDWLRVTERHHAALTEAGPRAAHDIVANGTRAAAFDPATWSDARRELVVCATPVQGVGYGHVARELLVALEAAGVTPTLAPTRTQPPAELARFFGHLDHWGRLGFYYHVHSQPRALPCERRVAYTMWESSEVPAWRIDELNQACELVYVPCRQNAEAFAACGLEVPVRVLHHGVDGARFGVLERDDERRPFTFGTYGDLTERKGLDVLLRAFSEEFAPGEDVALVVKSREPVDVGDDPRVRMVWGHQGHDGLLELLRGMDAFVLPSRGEGFGLCGLEAMATGLPLVATDWSGPAEYVRDCGALPLRYELVDAGGVRVRASEFRGLWAEPDVAHLRELMRALAEDRDAARERGLRSAAAVRERWTWARVARQVRDDLDMLVAA